jgi:hypothetical protein
MRFNFAALLLSLMGTALARDVKIKTKMNCEVSGEVEVSCDNKGPQITFGGVIAMDTLDATLIFTNNKKFTHTAEEDVEVTVTLATDEEIEFKKQPPLGGVGGNPHIYFLPHCDDKDPIYLGRCVQGGGNIDFGDVLDAVANFKVEPYGDCRNSPGPFVTLEGEITVTGSVYGCFLFKNNINKDVHVKQEAGDLLVSVTILEDGEKITIPKQPPMGGAGGNPLIYLKLEGGEEAELLGRCKQL